MKHLKSEIKFTHPSVTKKKCHQCVNFQRELHRCLIVAGIVRPQDSCAKWSK